MKFDAGKLATVLAVSAAALAGCEQRQQQACGSILPDGRRVDCNTNHGSGLGWFFLGSMMARNSVPRIGAGQAPGVSRGGFGETASGHFGGVGE